MLLVEEISVSYKSKRGTTTVLDDFSMKLKEKEILVVLGPSGCGKSTLIQVLAGMLRIDSGHINMISDAGKKPLNTKEHSIAVMPQNCGLLPWKTIRKNCLLPLTLRKQTIDTNKREELEALCSALQVEELLERFPKELSGGQRQRAALVRAFLQEPDLLLMDEAFSSLDAITKLEAWELFLEVYQEKSPKTLLVTHSIEEALYLGTEILVLDKQGGKQLARLTNPYFGVASPEDGNYLKLKANLQALLKGEPKEETT